MRCLYIFKLVLLFSLLSFVINVDADVKPQATTSPILIQRVIPNKIIYELNESATAKIVLQNLTDQPVKAKLRLSDRWDLIQSKHINTLPITMAANEVKTVDTQWNAGQSEYGHGLHAQVLMDEHVIDERSEYFNVTDQWWRVQQLCLQGSPIESARRRIFDYYHIPYQSFRHSVYPSDYMEDQAGPFLTYGNHNMRFCGSLTIFGKLTPPDVADDVTWWAGIGRYAYTTNGIKADVAKCKRWGVKSSMYTIQKMSGPAGFEIARENPEMVARDAWGAYADAGYASPDPQELRKPVTERLKQWYAVLPDLYNEQTVRMGANGLADSIKYFGWEGMFFDHSGYTVGPSYNGKGQKLPGDLDPDAISTRNARLTRQVIRESCPETFLWYNHVNPGQVGSFYPAGNGGGVAGKLEMIADKRSGHLKEIQASQLSSPTYSGHTWRGAFEIYLSQRNDLRKRDWGRPVSDVIVSGALYPESFRMNMSKEDYARTREQWAWSNHAISLMAAAAIHPYVSGAGFRPMNQLLTRYSRFIWAEDVQILSRAYKHYALDSLREVWWEDSVYRIQTPTYTDTIFCLVNSPDEEKAVMHIEHDPTPADDVEISVLNPAKDKQLRAWSVQPYDYDSKVLQPIETELSAITVQGERVFAVPAFKYFSMVIIRESK